METLLPLDECEMVGHATRELHKPLSFLVEAFRLETLPGSSLRLSDLVANLCRAASQLTEAMSPTSHLHTVEVLQQILRRHDSDINENIRRLARVAATLAAKLTEVETSYPVILSGDETDGSGMHTARSMFSALSSQDAMSDKSRTPPFLTCSEMSDDEDEDDLASMK
mmetsp:Transcript_28037/g.60733  ORF Transcript_28037/g.60733 Transcript_28037/m.60733 type:complete len:168 (-) Transcript_28037:87-590(-)